MRRLVKFIAQVAWIIGLTACQPELPDTAYPYEGKHTLADYTVSYVGVDLLAYVEPPSDFIGSEFTMKAGLLTYPISDSYYWIFGLTRTVGGDDVIKNYWTEDLFKRFDDNFLAFGDPFGASGLQYSLSDNRLHWRSSTALNGGDVATVFYFWGELAGSSWAQQANASTNTTEVPGFAEKYTYYRDFDQTSQTLREPCGEFDNCISPDIVSLFSSGFIKAFEQSFDPIDASWEAAWLTAITSTNEEGEADAAFIVELYGNDWKGFTEHTWEFIVE